MDQIKKKQLLRKQTGIINLVFYQLYIYLNCEYMYQNPRFEEKFYDIFYSDHYRKALYSNVLPSKKFLKDQLFRGNEILKFLKKILNLERINS